MNKSKPPLLEVCIDTLAAAQSAIRGGAGRLEVCGDLSIGGVTPGRALVEKIQSICDLPLAMMIRPRAGDFVYSATEIETMLESIRLAKELGVESVVLGVLDSEGYVDRAVLGRLITAAEPLDIVFHRAFDECANPQATLDYLMQVGVDRLLTSGQQPTAALGIPLLRSLVEQADSRLTIMPGAGIDAQNIRDIAISVGATAYHGSCKGSTSSTDAAEVRAIVRQLAVL